MNKDFAQIILIIGLIALVIFLFWFFVFKVKHLKIPNVYLITGGVKTGKSYVSVWLAVKYYKKAVRKYYIQNVLIRFINLFCKLFKKQPFKLKEKPMLYSNMHLRNIKYNILTLKIIRREVRIPVGSVVLIDEVSLLADSMLCMGKTYYESDLHERLMLFIKLFGHYCGGYCIINTQALSDCAFEFRRCIANYLWIEKKRKFLFFSLLNVREMCHSEDTSVINNIDKDVDVDTRPLFIWNKYLRYYDYRCYSIFTDGLPLEVDYDNPIKTRKDSLKTSMIVSLQDFKTLKVYEKEN